MGLTSISITPQFGDNTVTAINCGTSTPKLGGTVDITNYTNLQNLTCINNDITSLTGANANTALRYINVSNNVIGGPIFSNALATQLQYFNCKNNQQTGSIPSLTPFTILQTFDCSRNQLTSSIPSFNTNTLLRYFDCANNQITGSIPSLTNNTQLYYFACDSNQISGPMPSLNNNAVLNVFTAASNQLSGPLPSLTNNTVLLSFSVQNNQLSGSIPSISNNTQLVYFFVGGNSLSGNLPSLTNNVNLEYLLTNSNNLTGSIPSITTNTNLKQLILNSNQLTGSIPSFATNNNLEVVFLNDNNLSGGIPTISNLTNLQYFRLNGNLGLLGPIPSLTNNTQLINIWIFDTGCFGSIPSLTNNVNLQNVHFGDNQLTGDIPNLSNCTKLNVFRCANNALTGFAGGAIPSSLGWLEAGDNFLTQSAVDAILAAFVAANGSTAPKILDLDGTNGAPTLGVNNPNKLILESRGWTVNVSTSPPAPTPTPTATFTPTPSPTPTSTPTITPSPTPVPSVGFVGIEEGGAGSSYAVENWSNSGVTKTYSIGGSNVYGSNGYYQIRPILSPPAGNVSEIAALGNNLGITAGSNATLYAKPTYVSTITSFAGNFVNFSGYADYKGPNGSTVYRQGAISYSVSDGPYTSPGGSSYAASTVQLTLSSAGNFRIGVAVDSVGSGSFAPNYVSISNAFAGLVFSSSITRDGVPSMALFDIEGNAGDSFLIGIWQIAGTQSVAAVSLITFDNV